MIRTTGPAQGGSSQEPPDAEPVAVSEATPTDKVPFLTRDEKRRILAQIVRVNALDCFDDSGAFDVTRARRVLPPGAVRSLVIHETTRTDKQGNTITQRRVHLRLVDPLSAMRLDDLLQRPRKPTNAPSSSDPSSKASFNLLREKTMAADHALRSVELLKKALTEADDRELQLSKELEEKDRHLAGIRQAAHQTEGGLSSPPQDPSPKPAVHPTAAQKKERAPSCAPQTISNLPTENEAEALSPKEHGCPNRSVHPPQAQIPPKPQEFVGCEAAKRIQASACQATSDAEKLATELRRREVEWARNNMGPAAFAEWLRKRQSPPAPILNPPQGPNSPSASKHPTTKHSTTNNQKNTRHWRAGRPPPRLPPVDWVQGMERIIE